MTTHTVARWQPPMDPLATALSSPDDFSLQVRDHCYDEVELVKQSDSPSATPVQNPRNSLLGAPGAVVNPTLIKHRLRVAKCIVVGDISVGKTSLIQRFGYGQFGKEYKTTIGVDFDVQKFEVLGRPFSLQVSWLVGGELGGSGSSSNSQSYLGFSLKTRWPRIRVTLTSIVFMKTSKKLR